MEAARTAIQLGRVKDAAAAIDEIVELDRNLPELAELTAAFHTLRLTSDGPHRGPWLAAATVFIGVVLGASWLQDSRALLSHPMSDVAALVTPIASVTPALSADTLEPEPPAVAAPGAFAATTGERSMVRTEPVVLTGTAPAPTPAVMETPAVARAALVTSPPPTMPAVAPVAAALPPLPPIQAATPPPPSYTTAPAPAPMDATPTASAAALVPPQMGDDEGLVKQALQRYRTAYEGLDAHSARAVYPAVNQTALARAFDGLSSQTLTFDTCSVQLRGDAANATCRGTAKYVPKVGSREPRTEPRVWNFTLRRTGTEWKIDTARAER